MRIALLTAMARSPDGDRRLAFRRFLGRSILSHQVDCAADLGCEAILCLVDGVGQDVVDAQHRAEALRARFQTIGDTRALSSLVRDEDELIVIADAVLPDAEVMRGTLRQGDAVLTLPAADALPLGFERIDGTRAWAGVLRMPGSGVADLALLPPDAEPTSALMRLALQTGVACSPLDPGVLIDGRWDGPGAPGGTETREKAWIEKLVVPSGFAAPGTAVVQRIGVRLARDLVGRRTETAPLLLAVTAAAGALVSAVVGHPVIGLGLALLAAAALPVAAVVHRVSRLGGGPERRLPMIATLELALDALILVLVAIAAPPISGHDWLVVFVPLALLLGLRLAERTARPTMQPLFGDRVSLLAVLLVAGVAGLILPVAGLLSLAVLAALHFKIITRD